MRTALILCATAGLVVGGSVSCKDRSPSDSAAESTNEASGVVLRRYAVRAEVREVSAEGEGRLLAHHEAIPNFDGGPDGAGMNVMTMPFWPPAIGNPNAIDESRIPQEFPGLETLSVGDRVMLTFEVQHAEEGGAPLGFYGVSSEPLPEGTELDFETQLPKIYTFETRGQITQMPDVLDAPLMIRHEAVPDWPAPDGSMGMNTMTMQFWPEATNASFTPHMERIPDDLDLDGFEVGDKVLVTWEYQQDRATNNVVAYYAIRLEKLPDDTELDWTLLGG
ncbi:MAG: hypothetical protein AAGH64_10210 [Planctomycetota bacterium]